jgi:hypothetical protein
MQLGGRFLSEFLHFRIGGGTTLDPTGIIKGGNP